jgi:hypothetical protein
MYYLASQIVPVIQAMQNFEVVGADVSCPMPHNGLCNNWHGNCYMGNSRNCPQKLTVLIGGVFPHILEFRFTVSNADTDGIIDERDRQLEHIIKRFNINIAAFTRVL